MLENNLYGEEHHLAVLQLMVRHCHEVISQPNYPKDAGLTFERRLIVAEEQLNSKRNLSNLEESLRQLAEDIDQFENIDRASHTTNSQNLVVRTFNSIFNR